MNLDEILEMFEHLREEQTAAINKAIRMCVKMHSRKGQISTATENNSMSLDLSNQERITTDVNLPAVDAANAEFTRSSVVNDNNFHSTSDDGSQSFDHVSADDVAEFSLGAKKREVAKILVQSTLNAIEPMFNTQKHMNTSDDLIEQRSVGRKNNFLCEGNRDKDAESDLSEDCEDDDNNTEVNVNETIRIPERFVCDAKNCVSIFTTKKSLDEHKGTHKERELHKCNVCNKSFGFQYLKSHLRIHTKEKPYICSICKMSFSHLSNLSSHVTIHTGEKKYTCTVCDKSFRRADFLSTHMRIHTGEKPRICSVCKKSFRQSSHLSKHMKIHTGEKRRTCYACNKSFLYRCNLTAHIKTYHHDNNQPDSTKERFVCGYCGKVYFNKRCIELHCLLCYKNSKC